MTNMLLYLYWLKPHSLRTGSITKRLIFKTICYVKHFRRSTGTVRKQQS
jgi:hypothetical protein